MAPTKAAAKTAAKKTTRRKTTTRKAPGARRDVDGRPTEELVNQAASSRGFGSPHRPARGHGYEQRGLAYLPVSQLFEGRFGRMFRLPPYVPTKERIAEIAAVMTEDAAGGDPALSNPTIPAGYTYLGQFIDHDLTFDPVSSLTRQNDPDALTNFRSPRFDLDSLYGRGPADDAFMYDKRPGFEGMMLIGEHDNEHDLPRNSQHTALIGDPRNDENTFVGQLQLTMLKFHNKMVEKVRAEPDLRRGSESTFETAQRIVRWHYQWVVVHDFLRRTVGQEMLDSVLDETGDVPRVHLRHYDAKSAAPYLPVEFAVAAYRFGHSQVRGRYSLNSLVQGLSTFLPGSSSDPANLLRQFGGFRILPPLWTIEWRRFFEVDGAGDSVLQMTRLIDTKLANPLANLPVEIGGDRPSLIDRNLTRGARLALPSGQDVAAAMGVAPLTTAELALPGGGPAPLWYYILREARVRANGHHLGPVGGRIVAEVFLGILSRDPSSYHRLDPTWRPILPSTGPTFSMPDLVRASGHGLDVIAGPPGSGPGA
ncbi:heme peroxidase family protein [Nocardioides sp. YIM 152315]|uniref:peroxidase family protein n=1 Tax=Nocardioides sp. YIM 152315 TaxID=3031760 RepID=UPI0023DAD253|nr:heme peroxidase family protein [Nocardioides sp. YIM 152315]MDF1604742.1 heme peroxidase family protein [Nocardioides sp. YIM 152315]